MCDNLVGSLHLRGLSSNALILLQKERVINIAKTNIIVVDDENELAHAVKVVSELDRLIQTEAGCGVRRVEEEPHRVINSLVGLLCCGLLLVLNMMEYLGSS